MLDATSQFDVFPTMLRLHRIEPEKNMRRFYRMHVQRDLFGGACLCREWGRIGTKGQGMLEWHQDEGAAITALMAMAHTKRKRGYML